MERKKIIIGSSSLVAVAVICSMSMWNQKSFKQINPTKHVAKHVTSATDVDNKLVVSNTLNEEIIAPKKEVSSKINEVKEEFVAPIDMNQLKAEKKKKSAMESLKWIEARYLDQETGATITKEKLALIRKEVAKIPKDKALAMTEVGPDNIGGRTRAILVDKTNNDRVWAGGVSGGLFVSTNGASTWTRVDTYSTAGGSANISSMTQTNDGTIYVASGSYAESWNGNGVYYSTDFGTTWTVVPGTSSLALVNEIVSSSVSGNKTVWMATTTGVKKWTFGDASLTSLTAAANGIGTGSCSALQISKDGTVVVAAISSNKTYVSEDGGNMFADKSGTGSGVVPAGGGRIEYAISPTLNGSNQHSIYATRTGSDLLSMHVSHDNGSTWSQFVGASGPSPNNLDIYRNQGTYNSVVSVMPNDPEKILIGGIDIWQWEQTQSTPPSGGFDHLTEWFLDPSSSNYTHADNHEMKWDANDRLYVGNDGGIGITNNYGEDWYPSNRGYNATQFYGIAFDKDGNVNGGTQDNGTLYNNYEFENTNQEFREVMGGDGFETEISFFNPDVMFACVYYNDIERSDDAGETFSNGSFSPNFPAGYADAGDGAGGYHPFHTEFVLAENYDLNSEDSVTYYPTENYAANSLLRIPSMAKGDSMDYITPVALYFDDTLYYTPSQTVNDISVINQINGQNVHLGNFTWTPFPSASQLNPPIIGDSLMVDFETGADTVVVQSLGTYSHYYGQNPNTLELYDLYDDTVAYNVAWDKLIIQDPYQSWFVMYVNANNGELWGTRNANRFSTTDMQWVKIAQGIGAYNYSNIDIEFSRDLNECYVSAGTGVWRIDGLGSQYSTNTNFKKNVGYGTTVMNAGAFVIGQTYQIASIGSPVPTDYTLIGAATNTVGTIFVATGIGAGNGTAWLAPAATSKTKITNTSYQGLAVNPNDPTDLILFTGFSGTNKRCSNANTATDDASLNDVVLGSITSPSVACYDGIIDRDNPNIIVVGTSEGVFYTENGGTAWSNASTGFEGTPVYEIRQSWRTWDEGSRRPGEIYVGTYGRGIWSSGSYLSVDDWDENLSDLLKDKMIMYPNPTADNTTLVFNLDQVSDITVTIYNISGTLVKTIAKKNVDGGKQTLSLDSADLPKGTYIVKMNAGEQNETAKFIKM